MAVIETAPRPSKKRDRTRQAIIDAGQQLFARQAMEGVTIDQIVDAADVSKGSFYNHFEDRQGLADAVFAGIEADLECTIGEANADIADPAERVTRALVVALRYGIDHPERVRAILSLSSRSTIAAAPLNAGVARDVGEGIAQGHFTDIDLESGVLLVIGTIVISLRHVTAAGTDSGVAGLAEKMGGGLLRALGMEATRARNIAAEAAAA